MGTSCEAPIRSIVHWWGPDPLFVGFVSVGFSVDMDVDVRLAGVGLGEDRLERLGRDDHVVFLDLCDLNGFLFSLDDLARFVRKAGVLRQGGECDAGLHKGKGETGGLLGRLEDLA